MGKASRKNKKGIKFYFLDERSKGNTLRAIYAETEEEARSKVTEMLGHEDYRLGQLPHAQSKEETRRLEKLSEDLAGELMGPSAKHIMKTMHDIDRAYRG